MTSSSSRAQVTVARGAGIILAGMAVAKILGYVYRILIARYDVEQFGLLVLGISTISLISALGNMGMSIGVARFIPFYRGREDAGSIRSVLRFSVFSCFTSGIIAGIALWFAAPSIALSLLNNPPLVEILKICSFILPFTIMSSMLVKAVVAFQKIGYRVAINQFVFPAFRLAVTIAFLTAGWGVTGAMWAYMAAEALCCILLLLILQVKVFPYLGSPPEKPAQKEGGFRVSTYLAFSFPLFLAGSIDLVNNYTDTFMTDYFFDNFQVGIYGSAAALAALVSLGNELLNPMFLSIITEHFSRGEQQGVVESYNNNNRWCLFITLPISFMMLALARPVLVNMFGEEYAAGAAALMILTIGRSAYYLAHTSGFVLSMHGASRLIFIANISSAVLNVALNWILIPRWGITGAATATAVSLSILSAINIYGARLYHPGQGMKLLDWGILISAALPAALIYYLSGLFKVGWLGLFALGGLYCLVFVILLVASGSFRDTDRQLGMAFLRKMGMKKS